VGDVVNRITEDARDALELSKQNYRLRQENLELKSELESVHKQLDMALQKRGGYSPPDRTRDG
jgi:hypothetical protein